MLGQLVLGIVRQLSNLCTLISCAAVSCADCQREEINPTVRNGACFVRELLSLTVCACDLPCRQPKAGGGARSVRASHPNDSRPEGDWPRRSLPAVRV